SARDKTPPTVAVVAPPRVAAPAMTIRVTCDERCTASAHGVLRVRTRAFPVAARARALAAGRAAALHLFARPAQRADLRRALRHGRASRLSLRLLARDRAGNRSATKRVFTLRGH